MRDLLELRNEIDKIDSQIVKLFEGQDGAKRRGGRV